MVFNSHIYFAGLDCDVVLYGENWPSWCDWIVPGTIRGDE